MRMAAALRRELSERNKLYASTHGLPHAVSRGAIPAVVYIPDEALARHGNFFPAGYSAILAHPQWRSRLRKSHAQRKSLPAATHGTWMELDSSHSSDALLMNIFCHPHTLRSPELLAFLGLDASRISAESLTFGLRARVPLANGNSDTTEIDMRLGDLLCEAKLTESDFQCRPARLIERYRDLDDVFDRKLLPFEDRARTTLDPFSQELAPSAATTRHCHSYQLVRNVLAAHAAGLRFCVLLDARRPDLIEDWHAVQRAVRSAEMRTRCLLLTWQELAAFLPTTLQMFLDEKYGI